MATANSQNRWPSQPAQGAFAITPDDNTDLTRNVRGLFFGGAGNLTMQTLEGDQVTFYGLVAGYLLPVGAKRIYSTGTTVTSIMGLT